MDVFGVIRQRTEAKKEWKRREKRDGLGHTIPEYLDEVFLGCDEIAQWAGDIVMVQRKLAKARIACKPWVGRIPDEVQKHLEAARVLLLRHTPFCVCEHPAYVGARCEQCNGSEWLSAEQFQRASSQGQAPCWWAVYNDSQVPEI